MESLLTFFINFLNLPKRRKGNCLFLLLFISLPFSGFSQLPDDFQKVEIVTGLRNAISFSFSPDGRIFILDRSGVLNIYNPETQTSVMAGSLEVFTDMEEGLLGLAFDPQFETNGQVFILYSHPTLPKNRVSRFTMDGDLLDLSSEVLVLEWQSDRNGYYHAAGDMDFDSQGNLYIAIGDNSNHSLYAALNEEDPNNSSERTSSNTNDVRGKILRIKPMPDGSYTIPEGNLFPDGNGGLPEIYVMGARNPYKIFVDKTNTDWLFWADVGPDAGLESLQGPEGLDEINLTKTAGNYGWPYFAGPNRPYLNGYSEPEFYYDFSRPVNISKWNTGAVNLPPAKPSWIDFFHECYLAGPRYYFDPTIQNPRKLPFAFDNAFFYFDLNQSKIWAAQLDDNGQLLSTEELAPDVVEGSSFIDLKISPQGELYVLEYGNGCCVNNQGTGKLVRLDYTGIDSNSVPKVTVNTDVQFGSLPLEVNFSSDGTFDPDGDLLTYEWDFESDGIVDSNEPNPSFTYAQAGTFTASLRVSDPNGGVSSRSVTIGAGNNPATFEFVFPPDGAMISWEDTLSYNIIVRDEEDGSTEDGSISCESVNIIPSIGHLNHSHDGLTVNECEGTFFLDPSGHDTEGFDDIYYLFKVSYTDNDELSSFQQITVHPKMMEAEFYDEEYNTALVNNSDPLGGGKSSVRALDNGAYISMEQRNLINIDAVSYRVASTAGGTIELRSGSVDGTLISTVEVPATGGPNEWTSVVTPVLDPQGTNDLYFVFSSNNISASLFDLNYIEFIGQGASVDASPAKIAFVKPLSEQEIHLKFNEPLEKNSAEDISNYAINNGVSVSSAHLLADRRTVLLKTSRLGVQVENELMVRNIENEGGIALRGPVIKAFTYGGISNRINTGGPLFKPSEGPDFSSDQYFKGGRTYINLKIDSISGTDNDDLYKTERFGTFSYEMPVASGVYVVRLHFSEIWFGATNGGDPGSGKRVFNVMAEGEPLLTDFDVFDEAGAMTALIKEFEIEVSDGILNLDFTSRVNNAKLNALEVWSKVDPDPILGIGSDSGIPKNWEDETGINAYPNPFIDNIHIEIFSEKSQEFQVKVYDFLGKNHFQGTVKSGENELSHFDLDLDNRGFLRGGVYFLTIESKTGHYFKSFKMIKK